ncbi:MAG TPA: alpha/beta hydrolase [Actinomycetota bacterium]|nr:alpha/beta hydrolase [Actinomycetota bacterium]
MAASRTRALKATWLATQITGRISARLSEPFVSRLWFTPWPVPVGERGLAKQQTWLQPTKRIVLDSRLGPIVGFEAGEGPTILLVHGWGERGSFLGAFIEPLMDSGFRVVGVDFPGHGDTSWRQTNIWEWVESLIDVADGLGDVRAVVAHSMGGGVTTLALNRGLKVDAVALIAPPSDIENVFKTFSLMFRLPKRAAAGLRRYIDRHFGKTVWDELMIHHHVANLDVPALIVHDEDDAQVKVDESRDLAAAWRGSRLLITSGLGHDKVMRDPEVVSAVIAFLNSAVKPDGRLLATGSTT